MQPGFHRIFGENTAGSLPWLRNRRMSFLLFFTTKNNTKNLSDQAGNPSNAEE